VSKLVFRLEYGKEPEALDAAAAIGDMLEGRLEVESWRVGLRPCACGTHTAVSGQVATTFSGGDLEAVALALADLTRGLAGFMEGRCAPLSPA
jgi:hypothetical protein